MQSTQNETSSQKSVSNELGRRLGRNPPSVLGDIHLIGIPAPPAEITGTYYPFHGVSGHFTLTTSLLNASASSSTTGRGFFLRPDSASQPASHDATLPPRGWSFLRPITHRARSRSPTRRPSKQSFNAIIKDYGSRFRSKAAPTAEVQQNLRLLLRAQSENIPKATQHKSQKC